MRSVLFCENLERKRGEVIKTEQCLKDPTEKKKDILSLLDNEESGKLKFTALTSGLGFERIDRDRDEFIWRKAQYRQSKKNLAPLPRAKPIRDFDRGELAGFYENPTPKAENINVEKSSNKVKRSSFLVAGYRERVLAFFIDVSVIICASFLTLGSILFFVFNMDISGDSLFFHHDMKIYALSLFVIYYIFYFSFMDRVHPSSPGKSLFKMRVLNYFGDNMGKKQAVYRTFLSLIDFALLGLPCLLSVKEDLSETYIVKYSHEEE